MDEDLRKKTEQAEYRAKLIEAELNAIKSSRSYRLSKKLGVIRAQIKEDPVGLTKKVIKTVLTNPRGASHMLRSADRGAFIRQSIVEQTAKYQEWILLHEPDEDELNTQRQASEKLAYRPTISVITPVFNPPVDVFIELIESVLEQTYPYFELCLGDFGNNPEITAVLERYAKLDERVKYYKFTENKGIAFNSNQLLAKATGEYIALLDHDDTLSPDALYENAKLLNKKRYDFIYSDKDKIDKQGNRFDPLFKPEMSPEMMLNVNYFTHLNVMRTALVREVGAWDTKTDGAQDWDLFLRVIAAADAVGYIPKVLYHWRVIDSSTAHSIETKPYALAGQRAAVDKYLKTIGIKATAYHQRTELFLKWDKSALDNKPLVCIWHSNLANTLRVIRSVSKATLGADFVIFTKDSDSASTNKLASRTHSEVIVYTDKTLGAVLDKFFTTQPQDRTVLFILDKIRLPVKSDWYENLTGWLTINGVAAASGRLIDRKELIVSSGGAITPAGKYFPLFYYYPRYYQSYIGNAEWVRNLSVITPFLCATKMSHLKQFSFARWDAKTPCIFDEYFVSLSSKHRLVMTPHVTAKLLTREPLDEARDIASLARYAATQDYHDMFGNPNLSPLDPMRLFEDEDLTGLPGLPSEPPDRYQHDAAILTDTFDITEAQFVAANRPASTGKCKSVAWFLPAFDGVYAGLMNIFSYASYLVEEEKLRTTIYILKANDDVSAEREQAVAILPALRGAKFVGISPNDIAKVQAHDLGIATQWATTFPLAKAANIAKKGYFIQDNEVNFYPKGSISALVELSYRFGFTAIAGTDGLLDMYRKQYGGDGLVLKSKVDLSAYRPRADLHYIPQKPYKVFFYARPSMPRNAFELGIAGLKRLKQDLGDDVEIITAGAAWEPASYGVQNMFTNLGKIYYEAVPKLYRSVDAGLMFMFSGHPGVTASELMASGCPVVVNEYDDVTWHELYQHEKTCLITMASASEVARNLKRCLLEPKLRQTLINNGLKKAASFYSGYEDSLRVTTRALIDGRS